MIVGSIFLCLAAQAVDGDTLRCADGVGRVRLAAIDAPEMPGHCRRGRNCAPGDPIQSRDVLGRLIGQDDGAIETWCVVVDADPRKTGDQHSDRWGRPVARCYVNGEDLSATMLRLDLARIWP